MAFASLASRIFQHSAARFRFSAPLIYTSTRGAAWNRDWKPGPYPRTQAEREAAAKKYGLRVEDYEPYNPDTDPGYGDYPKMKWIGDERRDPYEHYEYGFFNHHYGEPFHKDCEASMPDRYDPNWEEKSYYSGRFMIATFLSVWGGLMMIHFISNAYGFNTHMPAMPKQYPDHLWIQRGKDPAVMPTVVHYTFEPATES